MRDFSFLIPDAEKKEPAATLPGSDIILGDKTFSVRDGDTLTTENGISTRLENIDTPEVARFGEQGEFQVGQYGARASQKAVRDVITGRNFDQENLTGKKGFFGRNLGDPQSADGQTLSNYLHEERVVSVNRFMKKEQQALRNIGAFSDSFRDKGSNISAGDKARAIVESVVRPEDFLRSVYGTADQLFHGSNLQKDYYVAEINKIKSALEKEKDETKRAELEQELLANREALTISVNSEPSAYSIDKKFNELDQGKPKFWGEMWNAGEKSLYLLENTAAGVTQWGGDLVNSNTIETWGEEWVAENENRLLEAGYTTGLWDIRNPLDVGRFVSSSIIQYGPQLGVIGAASAGGFAVGGPVGSLVAGTATTFMMAVSSVYQGQPEGEKDPLIAAGIAMPIALVDRFGFSKLTAGSNAFTKDGRRELLEKFVKREEDRLNMGPQLPDGVRPTTDEIRKTASENLDKATMEELFKASDTLEILAKKQILAKRTITDFIKEAGKRGSIEGATESIQEAIQEIGLAATTSTELDYTNLMYTMIEAGAIGSVVGGGYSIPGILSRNDRINSSVAQMTPESAERRQVVSLIEENMRERNNGVKLSPLQVVKDVKEGKGLWQGKEKLSSSNNLEKLSNRYQDSKGAGYWRDFLNLTGGKKPHKRALQAFRNFLDNNYRKTDGSDNINIQTLGGLIGGLRIFSGLSVTQEQGVSFSSMFKGMPSESDIKEIVGANSELSSLYTYLNQDPATLPANVDKVKLQALKDSLVSIEEDIITYLETTGTENEIGITTTIDGKKQLIPGFLTTPNNLLPSSIDKNFSDLLRGVELEDGVSLPTDKRTSKRTPIKLTEKQIVGLVDRAKDSRLNSEDRKLLREAGVFGNPKFAKYRSSNVYNDTLQTVDSITREIGIASRFGKNGEVAARLLEQAHAAGEITEDEMLQFANLTESYIQMVKGEFRPIKNRRMKWAQENILFASTLTYMDTNFFANVAEMSYGLIGLNAKQMRTYLKDAAAIFVRGIGLDIKEGTSRIAGKSYKTKRQLAVTDIRVRRQVEAGILRPKSDIAHLEGANLNSDFYKKASALLYKLNLVENQTLGMRAARAGPAWNEMLKMLTIIKQDQDLGMGTTEAGRYSRDRLNYYGINVEGLIARLDKIAGKTEEDILDGIGMDPADAQFIKEQYIIGVTNFTDEFSVRPEPGSSPKILEDPHLALFTQFKRFISHFTAQVIPRAWNGYIRSGNPAMSRSVFNSILTAYMLAMLSMMVKDYIVYGEKAPWLEDDDEEGRFTRTSNWRAAEYTGWMGTPAMALEAIAEMSANASKMSPLENLYDAVISQSPAINTVDSEVRKISGGADIAERIAKRTPFLGDIRITREKEIEFLKKLTEN